MSEKLLSIIIPIYNEERIINKYLPQIFSLSINKEIIIVNDGSNDNTLRIIQKLKRNYEFKLINHPDNKGKGVAIREGLKNINGDYFIVCDADNEYSALDISYLFKEIKKINSPQTIIYGSRWLNKHRYNWHYLINNFLTNLTNILFKGKLTDMETCFKLIPQNALKDLKLKSKGFEIEPEITAQLLKNNYIILERAIYYKRRSYQEGKKIKPRDGFLAIKTLIQERFKK